MTRSDAEQIARDSGHALGSWVDRACVGESSLWVTRCPCGRVTARDSGDTSISRVLGEYEPCTPLRSAAYKPQSNAIALREALASLEHEQWTHWTAYMLDNLTSENIVRWRR